MTKGGSNMKHGKFNLLFTTLLIMALCISLASCQKKEKKAEKPVFPATQITNTQVAQTPDKNLETAPVMPKGEAFKEYNRRARKGKPVLVQFYLPTSRSYKRMQTVMSEVEKEYGGKVEFIYLDTSKKDVRYEVEKTRFFGVPAFLFINEKGKIVERHSGALSKEDLVLKLKKMTEN